MFGNMIEQVQWHQLRWEVDFFSSLIVLDLLGKFKHNNICSNRIYNYEFSRVKNRKRYGILNQYEYSMVDISS